MIIVFFDQTVADSDEEVTEEHVYEEANRNSAKEIISSAGPTNHDILLNIIEALIFDILRQLSLQNQYQE